MLQALAANDPVLPFRRTRLEGNSLKLEQLDYNWKRTMKNSRQLKIRRCVVDFQNQ